MGFRSLGIFSYMGFFPDGILSSVILSSWDFFLWYFFLMRFFLIWDFVLMEFFPRTVLNVLKTCRYIHDIASVCNRLHVYCISQTMEHYIRDSFGDTI